MLVRGFEGKRVDYRFTTDRTLLSGLPDMPRKRSPAVRASESFLSAPRKGSIDTVGFMGNERHCESPPVTGAWRPGFIKSEAWPARNGRRMTDTVSMSTWSRETNARLTCHSARCELDGCRAAASMLGRARTNGANDSGSEIPEEYRSTAPPCILM